MRSVVVAALAVLFGASARAETALVVVGEGVRGSDLSLVESSVRAAYPGLLSADVTNTKLAAAQSHGVRCDARNVDCLVQLGVVCGADAVLLAEVSAQDKSQRLALTVVDVGEGKAKKRAAGDASRAADVVASLSSTAAAQTRLEVRAADPSTKVAIDDGPQQSAPFVRTDVSAGLHKLRIAVPGHDASVVDVEVKLGEPTVVKAAAGAAHNQIVTETEVAPAATHDATPLVVTGGVIAVVGVAAVVVGALPYFSRASSGSQLTTLEKDTTAANVGTQLTAIKAARKSYDDAGAALSSWAPALLAGGALVVGVGAGIATAALLE